MKMKKLILGLGVTGRSCIDFFTHNNIDFKIFDTRNKNMIDELSDYESIKEKMYFLKTPKDFLNNIDEVIVSPGFNPKHQLLEDISKLSIPIITDIDLFKRKNKTKIISVTGTNGKTTVVSMLEHALNGCGYKSIACGNNGKSPLTLKEDYKYIILELSSYQLEYMTDFTSYVSLITNITHDHIERHESFQKYLNTKKNIFKNSSNILASNLIKNIIDSSKDIKFFGIENNNNTCLINNKRNQKITFNDQVVCLNNDSFAYKGIHNLYNILAVLSVSETLDIDIYKCFSQLKHYKYLPHRIECIKSHNNTNWYNDSKSTNCDSTKAALEFLDKNIILILGGSKKNINYNSLSNIINEKVKLIIFLGENKNYIKTQLDTNVPTLDVADMNQAITLSKKHAKPYDSVLLSPASPSFDMYNDYVDRGIAFIKAVENIVN
ncbi:MAG: UDP-N-acetylmuramoyl-L-alanine--D-glutamate ligase [Gammaproteobacteria bacterium]|nr:UDP-N-acetylmuramoyl-L-alanine--D-glutamate ligase [Gammaproteobacteria bacterium]